MAHSETVSVTEGQGAKICDDLYVSAGEIWVADGVTKATLYTHGDLKSKPMSGGYGWGDAVEIGSADKNCRYYVSSIAKTGPVDRAGTVVLSLKSPASSSKPKNPKDLTIDEHGVALAGGARLTLSATTDRQATVTVVTNSSSSKSELKTGDVFWIGAAAYRLEAVEARSQDKKSDPSGAYEKNPASFCFKKLDSYLPAASTPVSNLPSANSPALKPKR